MIRKFRSSNSFDMKHLQGIVYGMCLVLSLGALQGQSAMPSAPAPDMMLLSRQLTAPQLADFSDRAIEKLDEWVTYLNLLQAAKQDPAFCTELEGYIKALYVDESVELTNDGLHLMSLDKWVKKRRSTDESPVKLGPPQWLGSWTFSKGQYERDLKIEVLGEQPAPEWAGTRIFTVYISKVEKDFGGQTQTIWEVKLGNLR